MSVTRRAIPRQWPLETITRFTGSLGESPGRLVLLGLVITLACGVYLLFLDAFQVGIFFDDAVYIILANALAAGQGYTLASFPDAPPELRYPPGFPVLLAPVAILFPDSLAMFRVPSLLLTLASVPLWFVFFRRRTSFAVSLLVVLAVAVNPLIVRDATVPMSEAAFQFTLAALLVLVDRVDQRLGAGGKNRWPAALGIAGCLIALYFIRTVGIAFLGAALVYLFAARQARLALGLALLCCIPFLAWSFWYSASGHPALVSAGYERILRSSLGLGRDPGADAWIPPAGVVDRISRNAWTYAALRLPEALELSAGGAKPVEIHFGANRTNGLVDATHLPWLPPLAGLVVTAVVGVGYLRRAWVGISLAEVAAIFYTGALLLYPWAWMRFLDPLLPLIYFWLIEGLGACIVLLPRLGFRPHLASRAVVAALGGLVFLNLAQDAQALVSPPRGWINDISVGGTWLAANAPPGSIVMTQWPMQRHLYTRGLTARYPEPLGNETDVNSSALAGNRSEDLLDGIFGSGVNYVMVEPPFWGKDLGERARRMEQVIAEHGEMFRMVFESPSDNVRVYEVVDAPQPGLARSRPGDGRAVPDPVGQRKPLAEERE